MFRKAFTALLAAALGTALGAASAAAAPKVLRVMTHSSFAVSPAVIAAFEKANNVTVQFSSGGDGGETLNKALLARDNPLADVLYGVDNTFMGRALAGGILEPYASPALKDVPADLQLDPTNRLLPVDFGYVSLNYDKAWFAARKLPVPTSLEQLAQPAYKGLLVVENPATSSPGLAFLIATIARFGETGASTWKTYWAALRANDVLVVSGWEDAYYNEFSEQGKGARPIVVSYATSPAYELANAPAPAPAEPPTGNILPDRSAFRQVEFVGLLRNAREPVLARAFIDFMLSAAFQSDIPLQMWVYPSSRKGAVPDLFAKFAPVPASPATLPPAAIDAGRDGWIKEWTRLVLP